MTLWIWLLIAIFSELFSSHDLSGGAKAAWFILVLLLPLFGALAYLLVRGDKMHQHAAEAAEAQEASFKEYIQSAAADGSVSTASQLSKLAELHDRGVLSDAEFNEQKAKILAV